VSLKLTYYAGYTITRCLSWLLFRPLITGRENLPRTGGFIVASNHVSYYDPPLVGSWQRRQMYFFAKKELFRNRLFGAIIRSTNAIPVSRGAVDRKAIKLAVDAVRRGYGLVVFPEGTRSRTDRFLPAKAGVGILAHHADCPIVPAYVHGANRLSDCFWRRTRLSIIYGEPLPVEWVRSFSADKGGYQAMAERVMERIGRLRDRVTGVKQ
jgi:1-acyl-sn-glycerol-3-phosphate acyltransferase